MVPSRLSGLVDGVSHPLTLTNQCQLWSQFAVTIAGVILRSMPRRLSHRPLLEDTDADFDLLKTLSDKYWLLVNGAGQEHPGIDARYEFMWTEAIFQTRKGWEKRREGWTTLVAGIVRCSHAHLARQASNGWDGDIDAVLREMRSNRSRSISGRWATTEPTGDELNELAELTRRADAYWEAAEKERDLREGMIGEVVRLVREGRERKTYGQTAAVARVAGWTREHCARLAPKTKKPSAKPE